MLGMIWTIIVGLALETAARGFLYAYWRGHLYPIQSNEYSLRLGWRLSPGTYRLFQINNQGFRRPTDTPLIPPEHTVRVFLVGGSSAFGTNGLYPQIHAAPLAYEDTIDFQLQTMLEARHPGYRFEVINAAVNEYRLFQEISLFHERLVNFSPHVVIFLDGHNDVSFMIDRATSMDDPSPYWKNRHFLRGQRVLNESGVMGPFYYLDIYLGRMSYLYYGLSIVHQRMSEVVLRPPQGSIVDRAWGTGVFRVSDEQALKVEYGDRLKNLEAGLPAYLELVKDLKAIAAARRIKVLYALQPELVLEEPADLTTNDRQVQQIAFHHHGDVGTLSWRHLSPKIAGSLAGLSDADFRVIDVTRIAPHQAEDLYTDYCHLTRRGNRVVAERLYPFVKAAMDSRAF
jgi:hypothetical protein